MTIITVQENEDGELFIELPEFAIAELGWEIGDTISWKEGPNGSYLLSNKTKDGKT